MKKFMIEIIRSMFKLFNFVFWYSMIVATALYVLPRVALFLQGQYEALNGSTRILLLGGLFTSVCFGIVKLVRSRNPQLQRSSSSIASDLTLFDSANGNGTRKIVH